MRKLINATLIIALLASCSSFNNKRLRKKVYKIQKDELIIINGDYECVPFQFYGNHKEPEVINPKRIHYLYNELLNQSATIETLTALDSIEQRSSYVRITYLPNNSSISIQDFENDKLIYQDTIQVTYKKGMLYLKNEYVHRSGIPLLLYTTKVNKVRIGLTENNDLYVQRYYKRDGMIFFHGAGGSSDQAHVFRRIKSSLKP